METSLPFCVAKKEPVCPKIGPRVHHLLQKDVLARQIPPVHRCNKRSKALITGRISLPVALMHCLFVADRQTDRQTEGLEWVGET